MSGCLFFVEISMQIFNMVNWLLAYCICNKPVAMDL